MNLQENIHRIKEVMGILNESYIDSEMDEIERAVQDLSRDESINTSVKEVKAKFKNAEPRKLTKSIWSKLENTESNEIDMGDMESVEKIAKKYNKTDPKKLKKSIESGDYNPPMIIQFGDRYHLVAGNTRLSTAAAMGITPKVLIIKILGKEKESGEKFIKCINCKKKFTQTIHKGKKSLPICPNCGTHNNIHLDESFSPVEYLKYIIDKNKPFNKRSKPGADSYERYQRINAFQKYVDLIYKYTKKEIPFEGVDGITVVTVWAEPWGVNFNTPNHPGSRTDWTVRLFPKISNPPLKSKHKFDIEYKEFQEKFQDIARMTGLDVTIPMDRKGIKQNKVIFDFLEASPENFKDEMGDSDMKQEQTESEITERCWKNYTQKGMKTMFGKRYPNCVKKKK